MITELLDCTIRDGGYVNNWNFTESQIRQCYEACCLAGIEYMEIGFRNRKTSQNLKKYGASYFCDEEFVNRVVSGLSGTKLAVMVTINEFDVNDFVDCDNSPIKLVRILMAYHGGKNGDDSVLDIPQLLAGIDQAKTLMSKGYAVSFNVGRIDKVSREQLYEICRLISSAGIQYFTMADTYGSVDLTDIESLIPYVNSLFRDKFNNKNIKIGFHAHDNCSNGTTKALYSLKYGVSVIDGCIMGFGRGSGNARTELLCMDLNKHKNSNYEFIHLIKFADEHISNYKECIHNQSYNVIYALTAYFGVHVSYGIQIIEKFRKLDILQVYDFLVKLKLENNHVFFNERKLIEFNEKPNFIVAIHMPHTITNGGTTCEFRLAKQLSEQGYDVKVYYRFGKIVSGIFDIFTNGDDIDDDTVLIQCMHDTTCDIRAKRVVKWVGYGVNKQIVDTLQDTDIIYYHLPFCKNNLSTNRLFPIYFPPEIENRKEPRTNLVCYIVKKGLKFKKNQYRINSNVFPHTKLLRSKIPPYTTIKAQSLEGVKDISEYVNIFNKTKYFFCYDPCTFLIIMALLCGCIVVQDPIDGYTEEEWMYVMGQPTKLKGLAYGMENIKYAEDTIDDATSSCMDVIKYSETSIKNFIYEIENYSYKQEKCYDFTKSESPFMFI